MTRAQKTRYNYLRVRRVILQYRIKLAERMHKRRSHLQERLQRATHEMLVMEIML